jgi:hypothetical protein
MINYPEKVNACNATMKGTSNTKNKATVMASSFNTDLVVIPVGVKCGGERTIQISPKAVYCKWFLTGDCALAPAGGIKVPNVTPSLDHHGMLAHIK